MKKEKDDSCLRVKGDVCLYVSEKGKEKEGMVVVVLRIRKRGGVLGFFYV
jgi:hypothetical protein